MKVSKLKKNPNNPREIRDEKFEKLKRSITEFPQMMALRPIIVDESFTVLGGNMRLAAIKALGMKEIPDDWVKRADELSEDEKKRFVISDNAGFGEWDWDAIANEWSDLPLADWGLDIPNFEAVEPESLEESDEAAAEAVNKAAELQKKWGTQSGQLWKLGEHRLICGDSTKKDVVARLMDGNTIDAVFTSPPYNGGDVNMRGMWNTGKADKGSKTLYATSTDDMTPAEYFSLCIDVLINISLFVSETHSVFWNVAYNANSRDDYGKIIFSDSNPFRVRETIVWDKGHALPITSVGILSRVSEFIFLMSKGDKYLTNQKIGEQSVYWNTWRINTAGSQDAAIHKACFPVELPSKALTDFTPVGANVYEPFSGTGTTLMACEQLKRKCFAVELSPEYVAVALERWSNLTGKQPELVEDAKEAAN